MARNALGKGLGALIGEQAQANSPSVGSGENVIDLDLDQVIASPLQPRKTFVESDLEELTESIREQGVIQPLIVRKQGAKYELIAGERRWRASRLAGKKKVPVIVRKTTDLEVLELALVENLQRADLNPVEEAEGYAHLAEKFNLTQEEIAKKVGKSRAAVANALRLRGLEASALELLRIGSITTGHAKALPSLDKKKSQQLASKEIIKKGLSVRQTEALVKSLVQGKPQKKTTSQASADWKELESQLRRQLGTRVRMVGTNRKGKFEIHYANADELDRLLSEFGVDLD